MLIQSFLWLLEEHFSKYHRWPETVITCVDAKSTGFGYTFLSMAVELVVVHKLVRSFWMLRGEGGHHILRIEHLHARMRAWNKEQRLVQDLTSIQDQLHGHTYRRLQFSIFPTDWIYDFKSRYHPYLAQATKDRLLIKSKMLIRIEQGSGVTAWPEPMGWFKKRTLRQRRLDLRRFETNQP